MFRAVDEQWIMWGGLAAAGSVAAFVAMPAREAVIASVALIPLLDIVQADLRHRLVPDRAILGLGCLGAGVAAMTNDSAFAGFAFATGRAAAVALAAVCLSYVVGKIGKTSGIVGKSTSSSPIGSGDIAALAIAGLWLPIGMWSAAVIASVLAASLVIWNCRDQYPDGVRTEVPFAAFLALASFAVALATSPEG